MLMHGEPSYTFLKPLPVEDIIQDLALLYTRLVDLGVEYRNGKVYLTDVEGNVSFESG